jgi:hypothetical protein
MTIDEKTGQSYLEKIGMEQRDIQIPRSDYNSSREYNIEMTSFENGGKGNGDNGNPPFLRPDMTKPSTEMDYSYDTTSPAGNACDRSARNVMTNRSLYGPEAQYGIDVVPDTEASIRAGQYDSSTQQARLPYPCPVV